MPRSELAGNASASLRPTLARTPSHPDGRTRARSWWERILGAPSFQTETPPRDELAVRRTRSTMAGVDRILLRSFDCSGDTGESDTIDSLAGKVVLIADMPGDARLQREIRALIDAGLAKNDLMFSVRQRDGATGHDGFGAALAQRREIELPDVSAEQQATLGPLISALLNLIDHLNQLEQPDAQGAMTGANTRAWYLEALRAAGGDALDVVLDMSNHAERQLKARRGPVDLHLSMLMRTLVAADEANARRLRKIAGRRDSVMVEHVKQELATLRDAGGTRATFMVVDAALVEAVDKAIGRSHDLVFVVPKSGMFAGARPDRQDADSHLYFAPQRAGRLR